MHCAKDVVSIGLLCVLIWRISHFDTYKYKKHVKRMHRFGALKEMLQSKDLEM